MTKRICWKKGMRLTDVILKSSDKFHSAGQVQEPALINCTF